MPENYTEIPFPPGNPEKEFYLGEGEKTVTVHLPWASETMIRKISVDDGAYVQAAKPTKKLLVYGDSITQGYDTLKTSNSYVNKILEAFDTEGISKAICGEVFLPSLPEKCTIENPDFITVAYGTNDWRKVTKKEYIRDCTAFYKILSNKYKNSKIFAITPLWRKDLDMKTDFRDFLEPTEIIENAVKDLKNVTLIKAYDFIPKKEENFADQRLHPNDKGFKYFANELIKELKKHI
jgi:lysophospholipase L1-like esterase